MTDAAIEPESSVLFADKGASPIAEPFESAMSDNTTTYRSYHAYDDRCNILSNDDISGYDISYHDKLQIPFHNGIADNTFKNFDTVSTPKFCHSRQYCSLNMDSMLPRFNPGISAIFGDGPPTDQPVSYLSKHSGASVADNESVLSGSTNRSTRKDPTLPYIVCPFHLVASDECVTDGLRTIADMKQHIRRRHFWCCGTWMFDDVKDYNNHKNTPHPCPEIYIPPGARAPTQIERDIEKVLKMKASVVQEQNMGSARQPLKAFLNGQSRMGIWSVLRQLIMSQAGKSAESLCYAGIIYVPPSHENNMRKIHSDYDSNFHDKCDSGKGCSEPGHLRRGALDRLISSTCSRVSSMSPQSQPKSSISSGPLDSPQWDHLRQLYDWHLCNGKRGRCDQNGWKPCNICQKVKSLMSEMQEILTPDLNLGNRLYMRESSFVTQDRDKPEFYIIPPRTNSIDALSACSNPDDDYNSSILKFCEEFPTMSDFPHFELQSSMLHTTSDFLSFPWIHQIDFNMDILNDPVVNKQLEMEIQGNYIP